MPTETQVIVAVGEVDLSLLTNVTDSGVHVRRTSRDTSAQTFLLSLS